MGNILIYSFDYVITQTWHYDHLLNIKNMFQENYQNIKADVLMTVNSI